MRRSTNSPNKPRNSDLATDGPVHGRLRRSRATQAILKELGKGWRADEEKGPHPPFTGLWLCCVGRSSLGGKKGFHPFLGIDLPARLARDPSALPPFSEIYFGICSRRLRC